MHPKITQVYDQGPAPKKLVFFAVFYIQDRAMESFETQTMEYHETKKNGLTRITRSGFWPVALSIQEFQETGFGRHFFFRFRHQARSNPSKVNYLPF